MASFRNTGRLLRNTGAFRKQVCNQSTKSTGSGYAAIRPALMGGLALGVSGIAGYKLYKQETVNILPQLSAAATPEPQASVVSQTKNHALYLWINLKPEANAKACAKIAANLPALVDTVCPPDMRDEEDEIWAGVGFGPNFYSQVAGKTRKNFTYPHRKGELGDMPSTGGDIFIHAKSNNMSKLFEMTQAFIAALPKDSVQEFEDVYSFVFQNGRDLSGFIDGTENPADDDSRFDVAVEKETGGSYVITQKWIHNLDYIAQESAKKLEGFVGRKKTDSTELSRKPISSHVARMTGGNDFQQKKRFEMVRQSMPFGTISSQAGLFFIGYAASPENFEFMLDRMVGAGGDGHSDDIMRISTCVKGTYWYFPSVAELKNLK